MNATQSSETESVQAFKRVKTRAKWESLGRKIKHGEKPQKFETYIPHVYLYLYFFEQTEKNTGLR